MPTVYQTLCCVLGIWRWTKHGLYLPGWAPQVAQMIRNPLSMHESGVQSLGQEDPWRRKWQPIPVVLPGESHGQRSLVGYSPWGRKESDITEQLSTARLVK